MNIETRSMKTRAEADLAARYDGLRAALPGDVLVRARRDAAAAAFERAGLPHRRVEDWKYSDLRARLTSVPDFAAKAAASGTMPASASSGFAAVDAFRLVLVDGHLAPALSDIKALAETGVAVVPLAEALTEQGVELFDLPAIAADDQAMGLNTMFAADGVVVTVPAGTALSKPIEIVVASATDRPVAAMVRNVVTVGQGASVRILESFVGGSAGTFLNAVTDYRLADKAEIAIARLQSETADTTHVASAVLTLGAAAKAKLIAAGIGSSFARNQTFLAFTGEEARADLLGITMVRDGQHVDQTLVVDHAVPHCDSREHFKAVVDDRAEGVFQGKIIVRPHAQKTDGRMMTQALLLSEEASMSNKPELEIFADDVQCAHGATSGQIDEDLLFYLRARGIPEDEARTLLVLAFLAEAVEEIEDEQIVELLEARIRDWLMAKE